jgi:hypothetical protein
MAGSNTRRHTPGLLMVAWAVLMGSLVLHSWRLFLHRSQLDSLEYPTALGDTDYYTQPLSKDDFGTPCLKFPQEPFGIFRQSLDPIPKPDRLMERLARDSTGKHTIYIDSDHRHPVPYYLKAAEDRYIRFGPRTHYPKAIPLSEEEAPPASAASLQDPVQR